MGGLEGVATTHCAVRRATTLSGTWPVFVRRPAGSSFDTPMPVQPEWVEQEGSRILAATASQLWLVLAHSRQLQAALPAWLEEHGLKRVGEQRRRTLLVLVYEKRSP